MTASSYWLHLGCKAQLLMAGFTNKREVKEGWNLPPGPPPPRPQHGGSGPKLKCPWRENAERCNARSSETR